jgi:putative sporulation protein YtaF
MGLGAAVTRHLALSVAQLLGGLVLIAIGVWMTVSGVAGLRREATARRSAALDGRVGLLRDPLAAVTARLSGATVSKREALALGVALALNNVASGIPAGAAGLSPILVTALAGVLSLLCIGCGARVGTEVGQRLAGRYAPTLAGVLLLTVGALAASR